jgi:hypothetical protein
MLKNKKMKIFNLIFCFIFIVFGALQYNDPDPYLWIPIYLFAAFLCWKALKGIFHPMITLTSIAFFTLYAIYKVFDQNGLIDWVNIHHAENIAETMKAEKPWVEESREFFGLVIIISVLVTNYFYGRKIIKSKTV